MEVSEVYHQFNNQVKRFIASKVKDPDDVHDILQEVYVKVISNIDKIRREEKIKSWLFAITHHAIMDYFRKARNNFPPDALTNCPIEDEETSNINELACFEECLKGFILQLPSESQYIIEEAELSGRRQLDLARELDMPYATLKSKIQRARKQLKEMLIICCKAQQASCMYCER